MKIIFLFLVTFFSSSLIYSQNLDKTSDSLFQVKQLQKKITIDSHLALATSLLLKNQSLLFVENYESLYRYDAKTLNKNLFSNIVIIENTYKDYNDFFRLCSPLDDSFANTVDSHGGAMLSHILNNFLNQYILNSKEPIAKFSFQRN